jgi:hypothetical protein
MFAAQSATCRHHRHHASWTPPALAHVKGSARAVGAFAVADAAAVWRRNQLEAS